MTTPADNRQTPEWKALRDELERGPYTNDTLAGAIYNAIERRLPPQASPASYKGHPDTINPVADPDFVARMPAPPPASEAERPKCYTATRSSLGWDVRRDGGHFIANFYAGNSSHPMADAEKLAALLNDAVEYARSSAPSHPTPADAGSVSVPREVRVGSDSWRLDAKPRSDGGVTINVGGDYSGHEIDLSAADRSRLASALSAPSPSPADPAQTAPSSPSNGASSPSSLPPATTAPTEPPKCPRCGESGRVRKSVITWRGDWFCPCSSVYANRWFGVTLPPAPPATVQVPLELAREIVDRDFSVRRHLESDHPHARLYDTLAAGVKEADRGK